MARFIYFLKSLFSFKLIPFILVACICFYNLTFKVTFVEMFVILLLLLFYVGALFFGDEAINKAYRGVANPLEYARRCSFAILIFGLTATCALNNYINPSEDIFVNSDHHVLRAEGVEITEAAGSYFQLAGNDRYSFVDVKEFHGKANVVDVNDDGVQLRLENFTQPIYLHSTGDDNRTIRQSVINPKSLLLFNVGDTISFHTKSNDVKFYINEVAIGQSSAKRDSVFYFAEYKNEELCSEYTDLLRQGLPMQSLMSSVYIDAIDFKGIDLIRPLVLPLVKSSNLITRYNGEYAISFSESFFDQSDEDSDILAISINDNRYDIYQINSNTEIVTIPYDTYFSIGYGERKSSIVKFEKGDGDLLKLLYQFPQRRYLSTTDGESSNTIYFTSSLMQKLNDDYQHPDHNILFELFHNVDNVNNMTPAYLSFCNGISRESIQFSLHYTDGKASVDKIKSEEQLKGIKGINSNVSWLLSIENFRKTTPFNSTRIILLLWFVVIMSVICIMFRSTYSAVNTSGFKRYCSYPEYAVYLVLIAFLTVRLFLMWRVSVFPPVSQISIYEFGLLRNINMYNSLFYFIVAFYIAIIGFKAIMYFMRNRCITNNDSRIVCWLRSKLTNILYYIPITAAFYGATLLIAKFSSFAERFFNILAPILIYLSIEFFIYWLYNRSYSETEDKTRDYNKRALTFSLFNLACVSVLLLLNDGGFGIMFVAFGLILLPLKLIDVNISNNNDRRLITLFIQVVIVAIGYVFYNKIILWLMNISNENIFGKAIIIFFIVLLFAGLVVSVISSKLFQKKNILAVLVPTIVICGALYGFKYVTKGSHTEHRARVLLSSPDDILSNLNVESSDENRFLQASLNDWLLGEYVDEGANVDSYFELSPHSRVGAMWGAQTTDIALARFIIAEHSKYLLPILFIFAFLALTLVALHFCTFNRWSRLVIIQIPLLLTVQALYIWMANTRMFIFIGQDFPFLSITSSFCVVYFLALMLIIVLITTYETSRTQSLFENDGEFYNVYKKHSNVLNNFVLINVSTFILAALFYHNYREKESENKGYQINKLLSETSESINAINQDFLKYQQNTPIVLKENMMPVVRDYVASTNIDSLFLQTENTSVFARSLFDVYVNKLSKANSPNQLLHIRKNSGGKLVFSVKHEFYNLYLPEKHNNSWSGGIVEPNTKSTTEIIQTKFSDFDIYNLPDSWFPNSDKVSMIVAKGDNVKIMSLGNNHPINIKQDGITSAVFIREFDQVLVNDKHVDNLPISDRAYFARNLIVNGQRRFIYPLQSDLYWAKNFAEHVRTQKSTSLESEGDDEDVQVSLNIKLTKSLIEKLGGLGYGSVIVADGDGAIKAMVDSRMEHELDPNDLSQINKTIEDLYMEGLQGSYAERLYFGNLNLLPLNNGPGSSQKPIVWNAVMSGYDLGYWDKLKLAKINNNHMDRSGGYYLDRYYNNVAFSNRYPFRSIQNDEGAGSRDVDLNYYISKSSNYYHSAIVYIGSFPVHYFEAKDGFTRATKDEDNTNTLFRSVKSPDKLTKDEYNRSFPIMNIGKDYVSFNRSLSVDDLSSSILHKKMESNYGLYGNTPNTYVNLYPSIEYKKLSNYVYAEPSVLSVDARGQNYKSETYFYEDAIRFTTTGARKVWNITPLKMAEMYGRLISQNSTYTLILEPNVKPEYTQMVIDKSWNKGNYFNSLKAMFKGMEAVFVKGGTAANAQIEGDKYFVYGKTGTINNVTNGVNTEDHILATVICNMDITNLDPKDFKDLKFYVIYTALYNSKVFKDKFKIHKNVYDAVVSSDCFNNYMNN